MNKRIRSRKQRKIGIGIVFIVVFVLIGIYLWDFEVNIKSSEQLSGAKPLSDLAVQESAIAENKIKGATDVLWTIAKALEREEEIQGEDTMEYLKEMISERNMDIIQIGVTDKSGNARTTDGKSINVLEKTFFQESMKGKEYVSSMVTKSSEKGSITISVPLRNKTGNVRGVLYGVIDTEDFYLYTSTKWDMDEKKQYIYLVLKLFITFIVLGIFYYKSISKEIREIEDLNGELDIKDKIFQIAISEIGNYVFSYDLSTRTLEFMNYDQTRLPLPKRIEDFPNNFLKYVDKGSFEEDEIKRFLSAIDQGKTEMEGKISIGDEKSITHYRVQFRSIVDSGNKAVRIIGTLKDITEETEKELKIQKGNQLRSAVLSDAIGFFEIDLNKDCLMKDGEVKKTDYTYTENLKWFVESRVSESYREKVKETFSIDNLQRMYVLGIYDVGLEYLRMDDRNEEFWVQCEAHLEKDVVTGDIIAVALVRNINAKKESELELKKRAILDPLTKAYNRRAGMEKINQILREKPNGKHTFMLLDLDNFKTINDNLGHLVGDTVLMDVVNILKHHVWPEDVVCRLGGDEFAVFLVDMPEEAIGRSTTKLLQKLNLTYERDGVSEEVSASIGIALSSKDGTDFRTLYEKADIALYEVKNSSKNNYKLYQENKR